MSMTRIAVGFAAVMLLASQAGPALARKVPASVSEVQLRELDRLEIVSGRGVATAFDETWGTPRWLSGHLGKLPAIAPVHAMGWILEHADLLRLEAPRDQLRYVETLESPRTGYRHLVFDRQEAGTAVWAGRIVLHVDPAGVIRELTAAYPPSLPIRLGAMGPAEVIAAASDELRAVSVVRTPRNLLRRVLVEQDGTLEAAWQLSLMWHDGKARSYQVLASSVDGRILRRWTLLQDVIKPADGSGTLPGGQTVNINVGYSGEGGHYLLHDLTHSLGSGSKFVTYDANNQGDVAVLLGSFDEVVSSNTVFKDSGAVAAHYNMDKVFDYFQSVHGWKSWNGAGGSIESYVHFDDQLNNAYWHGGVQAMFFGDGDGLLLTQLTTCLDVAGHELTHGVIESTVGLVYEYQPGALNEHIADFMGTMVDPPTGAQADWWLGESCVGSSYPTPFLRNIKDPGKGGQPGHAFDYVDLPNTEDGDWGGVHVNSGILNKIGYLLVTGLGKETTSAVYMELMRGKYIGPNASFSDFRNGWISACKATASASACSNALGAFDQVGVVAQGTPATCPSSASTTGMFGCQCPSGSPYNYATGQCGGSSGGCGDVPALGTCAGATLKQCVNGKVVSTPCAGGVCGWNAVFGSYQCGTQQDCGSVGAGGVCSGSQALHCVGGSLETLDCAQYGKTCGGGQCVDIGSSGCTPSCSGVCGADGCGGVCGSCSGEEVCDAGACVPWEAQDCGAVTFEGECDGARLSYCDAGILVELDCAALGAECGYSEADQFFDCGAPETAQPCGDLGTAGQCSGNTLRYCAGGGLAEMDCAAIGLVCGLNASAGYNECLEADKVGADGCGDVTWVGTCTSDGAVVFCENQSINTLQCNADYQRCEYSLAGLFYDCVNFQEPPAGEVAPSRGGGLCNAVPLGPIPPWTPLALALATIACVWAARRRRERGVETTGHRRFR